MNRQVPFEDIDKRQEKRELKKRLHKAIQELAKQLKNPADAEKMRKFISCLQFTGFSDVSTLPYYSADVPLSPYNSKVECLFAQVCAVILNWWMYQQEDFAAEDMQIDIEKLEEINSKRLINYKSVGNIRDNFWLEFK